MKLEMLIQNANSIYSPVVPDGVIWTTERQGTAGKLTFSVLNDKVINVQEGNPVRLTVDGINLFYGFVTSKKQDKNQVVSVTAYDQIYYLTKNKDTCNYANKTAGEVIQMLAADFNWSLGVIESTSFKIAARIEEDTSLIDIIQNALDLELTNAKTMFILYDDFGKLTLKSLENMKIPLVIDEETGENFDYTSSIEEQTYNKIKLYYENDETGKRDIYVVQDGEHINDWGILQYYGKLQQGENGQAKAEALLSLYNVKTRKLKITKTFGDLRVRAGCMVIVKLALGDVSLQNFMLVEKCVHTFNESEHWMELTLRGNDFIA
jgi:hypothetical protein